MFLYVSACDVLEVPSQIKKIALSCLFSFVEPTDYSWRLGLGLGSIPLPEQAGTQQLRVAGALQAEPCRMRQHRERSELCSS